MARNEEKALTLFSKWSTFKADYHSGNLTDRDDKVKWIWDWVVKIYRFFESEMIPSYDLTVRIKN